MSEEQIRVEIQHPRKAQKDFAAKAGIGLGTALAVSISWSLHKSILWAIVHGILSWFYVIYYAFTR